MKEKFKFNKELKRIQAEAIELNVVLHIKKEGAGFRTFECFDNNFAFFSWSEEGQPQKDLFKIWENFSILKKNFPNKKMFIAHNKIHLEIKGKFLMANFNVKDDKLIAFARQKMIREEFLNG